MSNDPPQGAEVLMTAKDVYEKYKHLDGMLSDSALVVTFQDSILFDCWQAIKEEALKD